jgi:hypothetical protein
MYVRIKQPTANLLESSSTEAVQRKITKALRDVLSAKTNKTEPIRTKPRRHSLNPVWPNQIQTNSIS